MLRALRQVRIGRKLVAGVIPGALAVWAATATTVDAQTFVEAFVELTSQRDTDELIIGGL